jgi:hypothetical protein
MLEKGVIVESSEEHDQFVSNIFTRPKRDGGCRVILNLKNLNNSIEYHHFKMDTVHSCINLMNKNCFMASLDLKDAYYSVSIHPDYQKFLKFRWKNTLYQFTAMPNGLACAPRQFTKLLKPVLATLRKMGHTVSIYLDDLYIQANSYIDCANSVQKTLEILDLLGFKVHPEKSHCEPTQRLQHLGFILDSQEMTVAITPEKIENVTKIGTSVIKQSKANKCSIKQIAQLIGTMVSCLPGVEFGELHYRNLEIDKIRALKQSFGNYEAIMNFSDNACTEIVWWCNLSNSARKISHGNPSVTLCTDASLQGWGAAMEGKTTGGRWVGSEKETHINVLELKAAFLGLQSLCVNFNNVHILIKLDNSTAVAYIKNMGGTHSIECNDIAKDIWSWCISRNIWLSASHIPGVSNVQADKESRSFDDKLEWKLDSVVFSNLQAHFGLPQVDLFASRINHQVDLYFSWKPDPHSIGIDALLHDWSVYELCYAFPPFSIIPQIIRKVVQDQADVLMVLPDWPTQPWYTQIFPLLAAQPVKLPRRQLLLHLPHKPKEAHPLWKKLQLVVCLLSGKACNRKAYQKELEKLSCPPGGPGPKNSMKHILNSGCHFAMLDIAVSYSLLCQKFSSS